MSKEKVIEAVAGWQSALGLSADPGPGMKDLKGRTIRVAVFELEDTLRFFFPRRTLLFHQKMLQVLTRTLRRRGAKIDRVTLTVEDYARWSDRTRTKDKPDVRYRFASVPPRF